MLSVQLQSKREGIPAKMPGSDRSNIVRSTQLSYTPTPGPSDAHSLTATPLRATCALTSAPSRPFTVGHLCTPDTARALLLPSPSHSCQERCPLHCRHECWTFHFHQSWNSGPVGGQAWITNLFLNALFADSSLTSGDAGLASGLQIGGGTDAGYARQLSDASGPSPGLRFAPPLPPAPQTFRRSTLPPFPGSPFEMLTISLQDVVEGVEEVKTSGDRTALQGYLCLVEATRGTKQQKFGHRMRSTSSECDPLPVQIYF